MIKANTLGHLVQSSKSFIERKNQAGIQEERDKWVCARPHCSALRHKNSRGGQGGTGVRFSIINIIMVLTV